MAQLSILVVLLLLGYFVGSFFEKKHYKNLQDREKKLQNISIITGQWKNQLSTDDEGLIFGGGVVVASDYFKTFIGGLKSIFGGRLTSFESLLDRGRREATLRMKEKANEWGAEKIINFRIETAKIGSASGDRGLPCVELYAYGTAIRKKQSSKTV